MRVSWVPVNIPLLLPNCGWLRRWARKWKEEESQATHNISKVWDKRCRLGEKGIQFTKVGAVFYWKPGRRFCRCPGHSQMSSVSCEPNPWPQARQKAKPGLCMVIYIFRCHFSEKNISVMEGEENDIFQVTIILSRALDNNFSLIWFRIVIWLIITSARICQRDGTNRVFLGNCNDIIHSATAVSSVKKEVCDLVEVAFVRLAYCFPPDSPPSPKKHNPPSHHRAIFDIPRHTSRHTVEESKCIFHKHINSHNHIHYAKNEEQWHLSDKR